MIKIGMSEREAELLIKAIKFYLCFPDIDHGDDLTSSLLIEVRDTIQQGLEYANEDVEVDSTYTYDYFGEHTDD